MNKWFGQYLAHTPSFLSTCRKYFGRQTPPIDHIVHRSLDAASLLRDYERMGYTNEMELVTVSKRDHVEGMWLRPPPLFPHHHRILLTEFTGRLHELPPAKINGLVDYQKILWANPYVAWTLVHGPAYYRVSLDVGPDILSLYHRMISENEVVTPLRRVVDSRGRHMFFEFAPDLRMHTFPNGEKTWVEGPAVQWTGRF